MTQLQTFKLIGILALATLLTNLPFLPGPNFLNAPAQLFYNSGQLFGIIGLIIIPIGIIRMIRQHFYKPEQKHTFNSILLWTLPLVTFLSTTHLSPLARDFSRHFAIKRATNMILDIENFKNEKGHYPDSLAHTGITTPSPGIIGIDGFYYDKNPDGFNLRFYQNVILSFNYEIVSYDQTNNHSTIGETEKLYDTGFEYWKYEIFD